MRNKNLPRRNENLLRYLCIAVVVLSSTLACNLFSRTAGKISTVKNTAQAFVTEAKGLATEGGKLIETVEAVATDMPDLKDTAEAYATENPGLMETAKAITTQGTSLDNAPDDIPLPAEDKISNFLGTENVVSFSTSLDYQTILDFYKNEMINKGWEKVEDGSYEIGESAILTFEKGNRQAMVAITNDTSFNEVTVFITISTK